MVFSDIFSLPYFWVEAPDLRQAHVIFYMGFARPLEI